MMKELKSILSLCLERSPHILSPFKGSLYPFSHLHICKASKRKANLAEPSSEEKSSCERLRTRSTSTADTSECH